MIQLRLPMVWLGIVFGLGGCGKPARTPAPARVKPLSPMARRAPPRARPQRKQPPVAIELGPSSVSWSGGQLNVRCQLTLVNRTGRRLRALSNFHTIYEGLSVVVRGPHGGLVVRQSVVSHMSPYAMDRPIFVEPGETQGRLHFPIPLKSKPVGPLEVQLVGGIRGTRWSRSLRSNVVVARWSKTN